jgi:glycerol-3-phosphate dehydrogenase
MSRRNRIEFDVAIVGGGIAGLWILDRLVGRGMRAALLEANALGSQQTIASQGMIHGGLKYALGGELTRASEAIAAMPSRWRACLEGRGEVDLRGVRVASKRHYLWANAGVVGRLGAFLASHLLHGRVERVADDALPPAFPRPFTGVVYALEDPVIDVVSLVGHLGATHRERIGRARVDAADFEFDAHGRLEAIVTGGHEIRANAFVFAAGAGNEALLQKLPDAPVMQRRPLHQAIVWHPSLPELHAHCISARSAGEPRLTITSHDDAGGHRVWYVGGAVATKGVARDASAQVAAVRSALRACLPWLDLSAAAIETVRIDRAEPRTTGGLRPNEPFVAHLRNMLVVWPTKLALVPDLGDRVVAALGSLRGSAGAAHLPFARANIAAPPWR